MANFNGFGGNMQQLMKQAQKMQEEAMKAKQELAETEVSASAGGGMVRVTLTGELEMTDLNIQPEAVDPDDIELLEDLIIAAYNEAVKKVRELEAEKMGPMAGALGGLL